MLLSLPLGADCAVAHTIPVAAALPAAADSPEPQGTDCIDADLFLPL